MHPVNMKPVVGSVKMILAENQPEYTPLPCLCMIDGRVVTEWELTDEERAAVAAGGRLRLQQWTGHQAFQPIAAEIIAPADVLPLEPTN